MSERAMSPELLEILACPVCKGDVKLGKKEDELVCVKCGRRYPIVEGIPYLLPDELMPEEYIKRKE